MFKWLLLFLLLASPAWAQNPTCPTRLAGDSTNACASTAFVNGASGNIIPVPGGGTGRGTFTANLPLIGNGTSALAQGTRSGNTTAFGTTSGTFTNGDCAEFNSGNLVDSGSVCGSGTGSGTVSSGAIGQFGIYPANGTTVAGSGPIYAVGMACNGSTDDTAAFQAAVTAAAGGWLILPSGVCVISSEVISTAPIYVSGQGSGQGPGVVSTQATVIQASGAFGTGDMVECISIYECRFEHMQFNSGTQRTGGFGLRLQSNSGITSYNWGSTIFDVAFYNMYNDLGVYGSGLCDIDHTYHQLFANDAIYTIGSSTVESGCKIHNNTVFDITPGTPANCMEIHNGYFDIYANHILGCKVGINFSCDTYQCGSPKIENNVIENSTVVSIEVNASNGFSVAMLNIHDNEISNTAYGTNYQAAISITTFTGAGVLQDAQIHDNVIRNSFTRNPSYCFSLATGAVGSSMLAHNICNDLSGDNFVRGISIVASGGWTVLDNLWPGLLYTLVYSAAASNTTIVDHVAILNVANLPNVGGGSQIMTTDGLSGSSPCSGTSGGAMAFKYASWKCF